MIETTVESKLRGNSLRKDFLWTITGNVVFRGCQWGVLVILAKFIGVSEIGKFALATAIVSPIVSFSQLHLRSVQSTDARNLYSFADYFGLRIIAVTGVLVVSIAIAVSVYGSSYIALVIVVVALIKIVESVSDIIFGLFQQNMRMDKIGTSMILKGLLGLLLFGAVIWSSRNMALGLLVVGLSWLAILIGYDLPQAQAFSEIKPKFHHQNMQSLTKLALPLGIVMGINILQVSIPKYFIAKHFGEDHLGYYAAVSYVMMASTLLMRSVGQAAIPRLAHFYLYNRKAFILLLAKMLLIALTMGLGGLGLGSLLGKWFLAFAYTPDYVQYFDVFMWLLLFALIFFLNSVLSYSMMAARIFKIQVLQNIIVTLVTVASCAYLVPRYELLGAAWAMLTAMIVKFLFGGTVILISLARQIHARYN